MSELRKTPIHVKVLKCLRKRQYDLVKYADKAKNKGYIVEAQAHYDKAQLLDEVCDDIHELISEFIKNT